MSVVAQQLSFPLAALHFLGEMASLCACIIALDEYNRGVPLTFGPEWYPHEALLLTIFSVVNTMVNLIFLYIGFSGMKKRRPLRVKILACWMCINFMGWLSSLAIGLARSLNIYIYLGAYMSVVTPCLFVCLFRAAGEIEKGRFIVMRCCV